MKNIQDLTIDYQPNEDIFSDDDEEMYQLKCALNALPPAEKIIMLIYCEEGSLRRTGKMLGVSHTIIYKQIKKIKKQMYDYIKTTYGDSNSLLLSRLKKNCDSNEENNELKEDIYGNLEDN